MGHGFRSSTQPTVTTVTDLQTLAIRSDRTIWHDSLMETIFLSGDKFDSIQQISLIKDRATSIGSERATDQNGLSKIGSNPTGTEQLSISQISFIEAGAIQERRVQSGISEISLTAVTPDQSATSQISVTQISSNQEGTRKIDTFKTSSHEDAVFQISSDQITTAQVSIREINTTQIGSNQVSLIQNDAFKVPFSSSISFQQFLSSHHYSLQNTTVPTWTSFLQETTPFNLNIEVTDLPTGQLAVACWR